MCTTCEIYIIFNYDLQNLHYLWWRGLRYFFFGPNDIVALKINESCHIWNSHFTYKWFMSSMNQSCHTWMSHVTDMNESCHRYEWVMPHMNKSRHRYEWVMSRIDESCHAVNDSFHIWMHHGTYEWLMSRWMSHVAYERVMAHMNESCHKCECYIVWQLQHVRFFFLFFFSSMNRATNLHRATSCHIWKSHVTYE